MPDVILLAAAAAHLGFQVTISVLVYPALGDLDRATFGAAHDRHSRRIVPIVGLVYGVLVLAAGWAVVAEPGPADVVAAVLVVALLGVTGLRAAPLHGRLGDRRAAATWRSLVVADRVRLALALAIVVAAAVPLIRISW